MSTSETSTPTLSRERTDLLETLRKHRRFLRHTVRDLTDDQGLQAPSVSALTLTGLIKHVADTEEQWAAFMLDGPQTFGGFTEWEDADADAAADWTPDPEAEFVDPRFVVQPHETLAFLLARYDDVARRTDEIVAVVDLDSEHPLPTAPWFEPGARWSARRTILHIVAETSQHAGHADIIRETIDGAKSMG
ncbi:DinB family protein [Pseudonocardia sp. TRM90224]|uniref:DinB family protein n=1 Tax=Pseudonocardia sp. TRM90224 TaxID=2812678 RepID=UPI001E2CCBAB|nr:DinB family protein [Pseudonocardia sp. TRM90224]